MSDSTRSVWVGMHRDGWMFIFDPLIQTQGDAKIDGEINIYLVGEHGARSISADFVRKGVRKINGRRREMAISEYLEWKALHGSAFTNMINQINLSDPAQQAKKYDAARLAKEKADKKELMLKAHRTRLESLGIEYSGTRSRSSVREHRTTHCWSCKGSLDNSIDLECVLCGWILCSCGACGCGYNREA